MLEELHIRNFALIQEVTLTLSPRMNILSGETGAGKSIIIGALSFLLGEKGSAESVRTGEEQAEVTGTIKIHPDTPAAAWLKERDISMDDSRVIVRRVLKQNGRSSSYIQSSPITRSDLSVFTSLLFDIHGQHEHQSLLNSDFQRNLLDAYADIVSDVEALKQSVTALQRKRKELKDLEELESTREREKDYLQFAVNEISAANLQAGEEEELLRQRTVLSQSEKLFSSLDNMHSNLAESQGGALAGLRTSLDALEHARDIDPELGSQFDRMQSLFYELEDVYQGISSYRETIDFSPQRLDECESRLQEIRRLEKKYGNDIPAVLEYCESCTSKINSLDNSEEHLAELRSEISILEKDVLDKSSVVSAARKKAAVSLSDKILERIRLLGMPKASFTVSVVRNSRDNGSVVISYHGIDRIEFLISANKGEKDAPLKSIASGGEISRVMLAIKSVLAEKDQIQTLIFDEVDAGIGGEVALSVAEHLQNIARFKQILCITHLATIAVRADNHIQVQKYIEGERTSTTIGILVENERVKELARMLSGDAEGEASLEHARDLISRYSAT